MPESEGKRLFLLGATHHETSLEVREKLALPAEEIEAVYAHLLDMEGVEECVVLNTCNRVELYLAASLECPDLRERTFAYFCETRAISEDAFRTHALWLEDGAVVTHLFEVASGLDSQMVGETEIFGQVKGAFARAQEEQALGAALNRVFQKAFQAAKWVRTHTGIGRGQVSLGNVVADLAQRICGELEEARILLIGSGEAGQRVAQSLVSRGARSLTLTSRRFERAQELAQGLNGVAMDFTTFQKQLHAFDIIISSTAAPEAILHKKTLTKTMENRPTMPLFLIDLAVPRDIEPAASEVENVYLFNLDDLSDLSNENLKARKKEIERARKILKERAANTWQHLQATPKSEPEQEQA